MHLSQGSAHPGHFPPGSPNPSFLLPLGHLHLPEHWLPPPEHALPLSQRAGPNTVRKRRQPRQAAQGGEATTERAGGWGGPRLSAGTVESPRCVYAVSGQFGFLDPGEHHGTRRGSASCVAAAVRWTLRQLHDGEGSLQAHRPRRSSRDGTREEKTHLGTGVGVPPQYLPAPTWIWQIHYHANCRPLRIPGNKTQGHAAPHRALPGLVTPKAKGSHLQEKPDSGLLCPHAPQTSASGQWYGLSRLLLLAVTPVSRSIEL